MKPASADGRGIKIVYVVKGGPADTVGLIPGDLITAANDTPVRTPNDLVKIIRSSIPGMTITISYLHEGAQKQTAITVLGRDKVDGSYRKAAEQGDANAQNNVGAMYANGKGVPQDYAQAMRWYRKAIEQGDAAAEYGVGRMYANGNGVPQDYAQAIGWFRKAAEQGDANAQYALGFMYANGNRVPQDDAQAMGWLRKAAEQGNAAAQD